MLSQMEESMLRECMALLVAVAEADPTRVALVTGMVTLVIGLVELALITGTAVAFEDDATVPLAFEDPVSFVPFLTTCTGTRRVTCCTSLD